jgi:hypothetical protein
MRKDNRISPIGLKGNEINERMRALMGIQPINENKSNIVIELTKMGPDGNAYAIVRENHEWYIKRANKSTGLIAEDFKYIGGLMNKKDEAYPSYAKAIKHLNLKFKSLAEAYNFEGEINVFENDNLLSEDVAGFSEMRGNGFSGKGNLEGNEELFEASKTKDNPWAICTASVGRDDKDKYEACVKDVKKEKGIDESITESEYSNIDEEIEMSEAEEAVDRMLEGDKEFAALAEPKDKITYADKIAGAKKNEMSEELKGNQSKIDANKNGKIEADDLAMLRNMNESRMSIETAIENMDRLIGDLTEGLKKKV